MASKQISAKMDSEHHLKPELDDFDIENDQFSDASPDEEDILQLSKFFSQETEALDNIQQIFKQYLLRDKFDPVHAKLLYESLSIYLGEYNAELLLDLLMSTIEDKEYLQEIKKIDSEIEKIIRLLVCLYGYAVEKSYHAQDQNPDSWRVLSPKINYELLSKKWIIQLIIEKYSGEITTFEESPSSIVQLISYLLTIINKIAAEDASDLLSPEEIDNLEEVFKEFIQLFKRKI